MLHILGLDQVFQAGLSTRITPKKYAFCIWSLGTTGEPFENTSLKGITSIPSTINGFTTLLQLKVDTYPLSELYAVHKFIRIGKAR